MKIIEFIKEIGVEEKLEEMGKLGIAGIIIGVMVFVYVLFNWAGMRKTLQKVIGALVQQLCSWMLTAIFLTFKLVNAIELYIVLLIDVLTGRRTAVSKVSTLAVSALSVASYYTTYSGMKILAKGWVAGLITIGVQTFLLVASLQIGLEIDLNKEEKDNTDNVSRNEKQEKEINMKSKITAIIFFLVIIAAIVAIIGNERETLKNVLHVFLKDDNLRNIMYVLSIGVLLLVGIIVINSIINRKGKKKLKLKVLITLYFVTLIFSSFFSYNSFMNKLYKKDVRLLDAFLRSKTTVIEAVATIKDSLDGNAYEQINKNIIDKINIIEQGLEKNQGSYRQYRRYKNRINQLREDIEKAENEYVNKQRDLIRNEGNDFGPQSRALVEQWRKEKNKKVKSLRQNIKKIKIKLKDNIFYQNSDKSEYVDNLNKINQIMGKGEMGSSGRTTSIFALLQKDEWTKKEQSQFDSKIEMLLELIGETGVNVVTVNEATALSEYKHFLRIYRKEYNKILKVDFSKKLGKKAYNTKIGKIFDYARRIVNALPNYEVSDYSQGEDDINKLDGIIEIEKAFRASNQSTSELEKNVRAFLESKVLGFLCAIIAVLIDSLILFVGLLTPQPVQYLKKGKYRYKKRQAILERLFNKPVG